MDIRFFLVLAIIIGSIVLQIFLSKRENKWFGRILPIISFLMSLIYPLNMATPQGGISIDFVFEMLIVFLIPNIPTVVFLVIYFACRESMRKKKQIEKMNIQDL